MSGFWLSPEAELDLFDIWEYIAEDSLDAADRVREDLYSAIRQLVDMPEIGHTREGVRDKSLRFWRVHSYLIVYRPDTKPVEIARILSGWRDIEQIV